MKPSHADAAFTSKAESKTLCPEPSPDKGKTVLGKMYVGSSSTGEEERSQDKGHRRPTEN